MDANRSCAWGVELVWHALQDMKGGEIYVKKIPSMRVVDIARVVAPKARQKIIGIRPGEKIHEQMIGLEDAPYTLDFASYYKIMPAIAGGIGNLAAYGDASPVADDFVYASNTNSAWMTGDELGAWIEANQGKIGIV